jgi:hypothetical protein
MHCERNVSGRVLYDRNEFKIEEHPTGALDADSNWKCHAEVVIDGGSLVSGGTNYRKGEAHVAADRILCDDWSNSNNRV